jgi:hypothetical protein
MLVPRPGAALPLQTAGLYLTFAGVALAHLLGKTSLPRRLLDRVPDPVKGLGFGAALALAVVLAPGASKAFIYFQF